jgi:hypothetical protein
MQKLPQYKSTISIIPGGCPQFIDTELEIASINRLKTFYREDPRPGASGGGQDQRANFVLKCFDFDEESQQYFDHSNGQPGEPTYDIDPKKALELFADTWVPVPILRTKADKWSDGHCKYERGPSNWARCRIVNSATNPDVWRVVLALDTTCEDRPAGREPYFALSPEDVSENAHFKLAHHERDNAWFLNSGWVDVWLKTQYDEFQQKKRKGRRGWQDENPNVLEYLAYYLTLLAVLDRGGNFPEFKVIDPEHVSAIDVDLILDIGNSRTAGILVETIPQKVTSLNDSYLLQIRDLSKPEMFYSEPFETRVEFSEVSFGNSRLSARSGRKSPAFVWPSTVRIGPEAARLSAQAICAEGNTGMSSPKRYLWDERPRTQQWRFNGHYADGQVEPPATRGVFVQQVNKEGTPLCCFSDPAVRRSPVLRKQSAEVAFEASYTRSSMMMFLLSEIIIQALVTINSPAQRCEREHSDLPRRLRRIIFTIPIAMPIAEQRIYRRWAAWAAKTVWQALGWSQWYQERRVRLPRNEKSDYRLSPEIRCSWDEATCTQLVYLYNELTEKFQGDAHHLFKLLGKVRPGYGAQPSVRIATIDVGGGTTDLSIATFEIMGDETTAVRIKPHHEFRDGFNQAGDDILLDVIAKHFLKAIADALIKVGISDPRNLMSILFGKDVLGSSQRQRSLRGQFARQVAVPVALAMMSAYEDANLQSGDGASTCRMRDFFLDSSMPSDQVVAYVEEQVAKTTRSNNFKLMDLDVRVDPRAIDVTVKRYLGDILANLAEVVSAYDCDLLLLTGRPSKWNGIISALFAKLPVPADRIVPMRDFKVGSWYPFADTLGRIRDPKTTVVVGAIICALSEGHLEGFSLDTSGLNLRSTARFIGEMDISGQIKKPKVWFKVDLDNTKEVEQVKDVFFAGPITIGFRQLEAERWIASRFYLLDFAPSGHENALHKLPYTVKLGLRVTELYEEDPASERDEGELFIEDIQNAKGDSVPKTDLEVRLQTMPQAEGYWLDTGVIYES